MANTYHQIYLQTVFAVKYRNAVLDKAWRSTVQGVIGNLINETGCKTIIVNGVEDHMHCFLGLKPVVSVSELMKTVKAKSSKYINDHNLTIERFDPHRRLARHRLRHSGQPRQASDGANYSERQRHPRLDRRGSAGLDAGTGGIIQARQHRWRTDRGRD